MSCVCRKCSTNYDPEQSDADFAGYCSQRCLSHKALAHGYSARQFERVRSEAGCIEAFPVSKYATLLRARQIGSVEAAPEKKRTEVA